MPPFSRDQSQSASSQRHSLNLRNYLPSIPDLDARSISAPALHPTKTLRSTPPIIKTLASVLHRRQVDPSIVPSTYSGINAGPPPGTVVGIVLGSVGGFLLLLWLIYTCFNLAGPSTAVYEEEIVRRRSHSPRRSRSRSEVIEVTRQRSPQRQRSPPHREVRRETVIVEETTRRPERERGDDIVEVIEEHSPPPPRRSRGSGSGGGRYYRTVDPDAFGGGNSAPRKFRR